MNQRKSDLQSHGLKKWGIDQDNTLRSILERDEEE